MKLGFIGVGNMAKALIEGWLKSEKSTEFYIHSAHKSNYENYAKEKNLNPCNSNGELSQKVDIIFLAVKPHMISHVLSEIKPNLNENKVIVSMAAGVEISKIEEVIGSNIQILRIMPNINFKIALGMVALARNKKLKEKNFVFLSNLFEKIGKVIELDEKQFSIFTALAGSSPAYIYLFIDAMARAGVKYGLTKNQADRIVSQAVFGSAKMVMESNQSPWNLIDDVSSPGGTTIEGLLAMEEAGFINSVVKGISATVEKDRKMN